MSDVIMIDPSRVRLPEGVDALEIALGGAPRGLVVLLRDSDMSEGEVTEVMNSLAAEGFESLAVEAVKGVGDLIDARAAERGWDPEQVGVVGIGTGGTSALGLARTRPYGAVVSISPVPDVPALAADPALRAPWLGLFGGAASGVSEMEVAQLRRALDDGSDVFSQVVVYRDVGADFLRRSETGVGFAASYDGWQRTVEWLLARVAARLTPLALAWRAGQSG